MRHFNFFTPEDAAKLFFKEPEPFTKDSDRDLLSVGLGGTLYIPSTRPELKADLFKMGSKGAVSVVVCLEDSIPDEKLEEGEQNVLKLLHELAELTPEEQGFVPLVFVRVRTPEHFSSLIERFGHEVFTPLTGFVFPKFDSLNGSAAEYGDLMSGLNRKLKKSLYYMPVLESPSIIHRNTRVASLNQTMKTLMKYRSSLLAVRIGATDMSSAYGLRRSQDFTVYDVHVVSSAIADIVNTFGRAEDNMVITGAVWEHFNPTDRMFKPQLRTAIFEEETKALRTRLVTQGYDTFIREIQLDKINGITGKTIIHPSHIGLVHSLMVVSHEEYMDACSILAQNKATDGGGALASAYKNKMNEVKPHTAWAERVMRRSRMFGIANEHIEFVDFLERFSI